MPNTPADLAERTSAICAAHAHLEGPMLPILHAIQAEYGFIPEASLEIIAKANGVTRAEVHGTMSFYHDFREEPAGKTVVKICRAEACQAQGGNGLADAAKAKLGVDWHGTTSNGAVTLEPVYCLGLCACGPAVIVDDKVIGAVDSAKLDAILAEAGA